MLGFAVGSTTIAACGDDFDIQGPRLFGFAPVDAGGVASLSRPLPAGFSGVTAFFQALEFTTCTFSNRVEFTFP